MLHQYFINQPLLLEVQHTCMFFFCFRIFLLFTLLVVPATMILCFNIVPPVVGLWVGGGGGVEYAYGDGIH